jgi:hypothetical protein
MKKILILLFSIIIFIAFSTAIWFSKSTVIKTSGDIYHSILLPIGFDGGGIKWRSNFSIHAENPNLASLQGPIVYVDNNEYVAHWICASEVQVKISKPAFSIECQDRSYSYQLHTALLSETFAKAEYAMPNDIAVISDLEGDAAFFNEWARLAGVTDENGNWAFGDGHLVIAGDSVDRGRQVFDLLWHLYQLQQQAFDAGGRVHMLIGNHEQYAFVSQIKSVETEHLWAASQINKTHAGLAAVSPLGYADVYSEKTILGKWLLAQPVVLKLGDILFTHGGISPTLLAADLSLTEINNMHVRVLKAYATKDDVVDDEFTLMHGNESPTQYRGYVQAGDEYPLANAELIQQTKAHFDIKRIVVGHNSIDSLTASFNNSVFVVDNLRSKPQSLFFVNGEPEIRNIGETRIRYKDTAMSSREFDVFNQDDWQAFLGVFGNRPRN